MLSIKYIKEHIQDIRTNIANRNADVSKLDDLLKVDEKRIELTTKLNEINKSRNEISANIKGKPSEELVAKAKQLKSQKEELEHELKEIEDKFYDLISWIPNIVSADTPIGHGEEGNVEIAAWIPKEGYLKAEKLGKCNYSSQSMPKNAIHADKTDFTLRDHITLGEMNDLIDVKQSAIVSGSRFSYIKNEAVLLQMALVDLLTKKLLEKEFSPIIPPLLVRERALFGTSHFPTDRDQVYMIDQKNVEENNQLFLVGSSEPSNFAYFIDKTLTKAEFPKKMFANTSCFRSEVGSWGKDVRGIKRVHQFDKLEMDVVCLPEQSEDVFNELLEINKWFWTTLEIPFHIIQKCTGDMGYYASFKQCDVEAWLPSQNTFMEVGTDTNATLYQARRLNTKYIGDDGQKHYVHTVNDTGCALGRALIAIFDNYQQSDGSIKIPTALQDYLKFDIIKK